MTKNSTQLPFPAETFDLVISCVCMEQVPHPKIMATEIARVAKRSARFCLTTENYYNGMTSFFGFKP